MKKILEDFQNAAFVYEGKKYKVVKAKIINNIAVIQTDRVTFSKTASELQSFYDEVEFIADYTTAVVAQPNVLQAEVIQTNKLSNRLTDSLEAVFNEIASGQASDQTYKKADAMVKASNAIINVQMANYKFLTLK